MTAPKEPAALRRSLGIRLIDKGSGKVAYLTEFAAFVLSTYAGIRLVDDVRAFKSWRDGRTG